MWDSSALVKLYADEDGAAEARTWSAPIVISALSVAEVLAAVWGKVARGELDDEHAAALDRAFIADLRGGRFLVLPVADEVIARSLACVRRHRLRGADAVQLASALAAREADPAVNTMAVFDRRLRAAASAESLALLPAA
ncbi:MAG TPA: type II toxin-antitoxin system VapC family toxin [Solirubrobacter sp.]|nr:type II toxin-antitoxin system VapC family toxin [Solirubrobacter sp.]